MAGDNTLPVDTDEPDDGPIAPAETDEPSAPPASDEGKAKDEMIARLKEENESYRTLISSAAATVQPPAPQPPSKESELERQKKIREAWNAGDYAKAEALAAEPIVQPLLKRLEQLEGRLGTNEGEAIFDKLSRDARYPHATKLRDAMSKIASERMGRNPDYFKAFATPDERFNSLYAEAVSLNPDVAAKPEPKGNLSAALTGVRGAPGARKAVPAVKQDSPVDTSSVARSLGIRPHPEQGRLNPVSKVLRDFTQRLEAEEAVARAG